MTDQLAIAQVLIVGAGPVGLAAGFDKDGEAIGELKLEFK